LDIFLNAGPHFINANGIGTIMRARQPKRVPAHWTPRFWNICFVKRGNAAATEDRMIVLAAKTDAALIPKLELSQNQLIIG
jgi:hypothetical protein